MHLAAETHVDRSIDSPAAFVETNVTGTVRLLDAALAQDPFEPRHVEGRVGDLLHRELAGHPGQFGNGLHPRRTVADDADPAYLTELARYSVAVTRALEDSEIRGNVSEGNLRYGLHFMYSDNCIYEENTFRRNGSGVAVMYTKGVQMIGNRFEDNWGPSSYGLLLKEIYDSYTDLSSQFFTAFGQGVTHERGVPFAASLGARRVGADHPAAAGDVAADRLPGPAPHHDVVESRRITVRAR